MSKRKRDDHLDGSEVEDNHLKIKVSRLKAKTGQGVKILHDALKLARGFERQKLGRRQKSAGEEPHTLLRLREEVIVLKELQLERVARTRLLKYLVKIKRIKEHPAFIKTYGSDPELSHFKPGAETNVVGRLFNSNPVKQALPQITKSIHVVLGTLHAVPAKSSTSDKSAGEVDSNKQSAPAEDAFDGFSGNEAADEVGPRQESLSGADEDDEDLFENAKGRLASSDEESEDGSVDFSSISRQNKRDQGHSSKGLNRREDFSLSPSHSDISDSGRDEIPPAAPPLRETPGQTAFLPSLSMGGYYSGSESGSDTEQYHGPALPKPRNNRRGQRARQQLAELKYGKTAKHLGKQQDDRSSGWDAKRGAVGQAGGSRDGFRRAKAKPKSAGDRLAAGTNRPSKTIKPKSADDQGPLHPSWEAAKKRKMQDQTQASFQGKKTTFE